jgi:hypothetical protein
MAQQMNQVFLTKGAAGDDRDRGQHTQRGRGRGDLRRAAAPPPSQASLYREVENVIAAFNRIKDDLIAGGNSDLTLDLVMQLNRWVLDGLEREDVRPGEILGRARPSVMVGAYRGAPLPDCEYLVGRLCEWLNGAELHPPSEDGKIPMR